MKLKLFWTPRILPLFFKGRIWRSTSKNSIHLTFDDGPHPSITPWLLDYAKQQDIHFNFFWLGKNVELFPQLLVRAKEEGHLIANHGYDHIHANKTSKESYIENIEAGQAYVPHKMFRPPYGRLSWRMAIKIKKKTPIIMWTFLSYDWDKNTSNDEILHQLKKNLKPGAILVFHESEKTINRYKELIPKVVEEIKSRGLKIDLLPL